MTKNIVPTMIKQHRDLQSLTGKILDLIKKQDIGLSVEIVALLDKFKKDFVAHLALENNVFYVELLQKMKDKGQDISKTEEFINEMKIIEKKVFKFFDKCVKTKKIKSNFPNCAKEFVVIVDILIFRIESEEIGVYDYWGLF
jgi:hemerythrin-like domain-containing protein